MDFGIAMYLFPHLLHLWFFPSVFWKLGFIKHGVLVTCNFSVPNFEGRRTSLLKICKFGGPLFLAPFSSELEKEKITIGCCSSNFSVQERKDKKKEEGRENVQVSVIF